MLDLNNVDDDHDVDGGDDVPRHVSHFFPS